MVTWHAVPTVPCNTGTEDRGQAEADLSAGRATTTGILPTASLTSQVPIVMTEEVAPRAILLSQRPHLDLGAEPDRGAAGHNRALRRDGRLPAPRKPKLFSRQRRRAAAESGGIPGYSKA